MKLSELIDSLRRPDAYPHEVDEVVVLQTHISVLFFAGDRVYKIKKPLDLGFLDFTSLGRRQHFCHEEVRLNRRLAPAVYLGVAPIVQTPDGSIRIGARGAAIEYAVEMVRLPRSRMLDRMLDAGLIDNETIDDLTRLLARFHQQAATGPEIADHGSPLAVRRNLIANLDGLERLAATRGAAPGSQAILSRLLLDRLRVFAERFLSEHETLMEYRASECRVREGHGDLHAGNICLLEEGIVIYDCLEFAEHLRCCDVAADLAFLAMDLDFRGYRGFSGYLVRRYVEHSGDGDVSILIGGYKLHLACVRAKVHSIAAADESRSDADRADDRALAMRYVHLAAGYTLPPALVLMCGVPASGKSWLAAELARPFEAVVLRTDVIRKRLAGVPPTEGRRDQVDEGLYSEDHSDRTYAALQEQAAAHLREGRTVIADATFGRARRRRELAQVAERQGAACVVVHVTCPVALARERLVQRAGDPANVSDADVEVLERALERFEPPEAGEAAALVAVPGMGEAGPSVGAVIDAIIEEVSSLRAPSTASES